MREVKPTQKPVPSSDIKDLFFNSGLLDIWATSLERKYIDRFGNCHLTAAGMEWLFKELVEKFKVDMNIAIVAAGYITIDSFQQGADLPNNELTQRNHILRDETTGEYYRWDGDLPKQVPAGSTPQSTGGISKGAWVSVGDASLRGNLRSEDGLSLIGETNYEGVRNYTGSNSKIGVYGISNVFDGGNGTYLIDASDSTSSDNGGAVIIDALGRRWKRQYTGPASVRWFGAVGDGITNDRLAIQTAISSCDEVHGFDSEYYIGETSTDKNEYLLSIKDTKNKIIKLNVAFKDNFHVHSDNPNAVIAILDGCIGSNIDIKVREISSTTDYGASSVSAVHIECHERDITNTTVKVEAIRCLAGLTAWAPDSAKCERLNVDISTTGCHYGLRAVTNINYIFGNVKSHIVRRTVFLADVYNASINSQSSLNYQVNDILIKSYGKTVSNIVINHNQSDSSSTEWPVVIESQYSSSASFRAIKVNLNTNKTGDFQTLNKGMFSIASRNVDSSIKEYSDDTFVDIKLRLNGSFRRDPAYKKTQLLNIRSIMTTRPVFDVDFDIKNHDLKRSSIFKNGEYVTNYIGRYADINPNNGYLYIGFTDDFDCITIEVKGCSSLSTPSDNVFYAKYVMIASGGVVKNMNLVHEVRMQSLLGNIVFEKSGPFLLVKSFTKTELFNNTDSYIEISVSKN